MKISFVTWPPLTQNILFFNRTAYPTTANLNKILEIRQMWTIIYWSVLDDEMIIYVICFTRPNRTDDGLSIAHQSIIKCYIQSISQTLNYRFPPKPIISLHAHMYCHTDYTERWNKHPFTTIVNLAQENYWSGVIKHICWSYIQQRQNDHICVCVCVRMRFFSSK